MWHKQVLEQLHIGKHIESECDMMVTIQYLFCRVHVDKTGDHFLEYHHVILRK